MSADARLYYMGTLSTVILTALMVCVNPSHAAETSVCQAQTLSQETVSDLQKNDKEIFFRDLAGCMYEMSEKSREEKIKGILDKVSYDQDQFREICEAAERHFGNIDSPLHNDSFLIPFLKEAIASPHFSDDEKIRLDFLLGLAMKNRPGTKAADFMFETAEGEQKSLYSLSSANQTILVFYDPDCNHCMETFDSLREMQLPSHVAVVAIDAEEDRLMWEAAKNALPKEWVNGYSLSPIYDEDIYVIQTSPTIYLLDHDKTVLLKDTNLAEISNALNPAE